MTYKIRVTQTLALVAPHPHHGYRWHGTTTHHVTIEGPDGGRISGWVDHHPERCADPHRSWLPAQPESYEWWAGAPADAELRRAVEARIASSYSIDERGEIRAIQSPL